MTESHDSAQGPEPQEEPKAKKAAWWRPVLLLAVVVTLIVLAQVFGLGGKLGALRDWISSLGPWGPAVFFLIYVAGTVAAIPGAAMTVAGGALFGSFWGTILVLHAATVGASLAFLISRYFARESIVRWLGKNEQFQRLDRLTEKHGAIMVALTRLVPIFPFNLLNYGFGLTSVPFWTYVFWSWLCMAPGTILYVVGSDAIFTAAARGEVPWSLVVVLLVAVVVLAVLVNFARKKLQMKESLARAASVSPEDDVAPPTPELAPLDEHNQTLAANVHPSDWQNPKPAPRYHLVVVGAGTAGLVTAAGAAGLGARVALVERHLLGGDCLNYGCVPSKAIISSSRLAADIREAERFGIRAPDRVEVDFEAVMERMRRLRAGISGHDSAQRFQDIGVDVFLGQARFTGPDTLEVNGKTLRFKRAVIATGARAVHPNVPGLAETGFLTNETVFSLTARPARLAVLGGGPIGCELAQSFQRLGSQVSLIHKYDHLMNREDRDAAEIIQSVFEKEGINLILKANPLQVVKTETGKVIHYEVDGQAGEIEVDEILVGAGRTPNVEGLGLAAAGVEYDPRQGVKVNDRLQTTNPHIYAAGDICLSYKFTHMADVTARIVIQNALFFGRRKLSTLIVPWCTYTDPEVAHVGLGDAEAQKQKVPFQTFIKHFADVDRAIVEGDTTGFVKVLVQEGKDKILGATIVSSHAGEMISEISVAMAAGLGLKALSGVIHPYPTRAEAIKQVGDLYQKSRFTPRLKNIFAKYFSWWG